MDRNAQSDAGRGGAPSQTKENTGSQMPAIPAKGKWLPAYSGGMGRSAEQIDPDLGSAGDETGNDHD